MSRWRIAVLTVLALAPFVFLTALGSFYLWETNWSFRAWWIMAACWAVAYGLAWYWQRTRKLLPSPDVLSPAHWTDRDRVAWKLIEARARAAPQLDPDKLAEIQTYVDTAVEMAGEMARHYHPGAADPVGKLTIPEILAVIELASHDMAELVDRYLPGGHLLTVDNWKQARRATDWYRTASNIYWLISAVFSPLQTGARFAASQLGMSLPWQQLQQNLLVWFYTAYLQRLGTYLIDVNSGRLRVGARRYRELVELRSGDGRPADADEAVAAPAVTITVMGQVKAGKSSLINAILGEQRARTDVLPATAEITRYQLQAPGIASRLVLLDTVGYAHTGPREDQLRATEQAARESDLLLLVLQARNPARQADLELAQALARWFAHRPDLKLPPILGIVTHIDLLSPAMEWAPPYNWQEPSRLKEQQIQQALATVRDQFAGHLVGCIPVCSAPGKLYGVEEWLLPAVAERLDEAHGVALLRCLRAEADARKVRRLLRQLLAAGTELTRHVFERPHAANLPMQDPTSPSKQPR
jgi:predicted GTPase